MYTSRSIHGYHVGPTSYSSAGKASAHSIVAGGGPPRRESMYK